MGLYPNVVIAFVTKGGKAISYKYNRGYFLKQSCGGAIHRQKLYG
jgi:hypothetical protein